MSDPEIICRLVHAGQLNMPGSADPIEIPNGMDNALAIGRSREKCSVVYNDTRISTIHCKITVKMPSSTARGALNPQVWLEDCSSNGTFVNSQLVGKGRSVPLAHNDEIGLIDPCCGEGVEERPTVAFVVLLASQSSSTGHKSVDLKRYRSALAALPCVKVNAHVIYALLHHIRERCERTPEMPEA